MIVSAPRDLKAGPNPIVTILTYKQEVQCGKFHLNSYNDLIVFAVV